MVAETPFDPLDALERGLFSGRKLAVLGAGYVGGALTALALRGGMKVTALTRNHAKANQLQHAGAQTVIAQLDAPTWFEQVPRDQDYVVDCVSSAGGGLAGYRRSYVAGLDAIRQWASGGATGAHFVFTSSTSVYPQTDGRWVDEDASAEGCSEAGKILLEAESRVANAGFEQWQVLRLAGIYGPGRHFLLDALRERRSEFPGSGTDYLNLIHQWDICRAIFQVLLQPDAPESGVYNVADGHPAPKQEIVGWLAEQLGQEAPAFNPEMQTGRASRRTNEQGKLPNRRISAAKLQAATDWRPRYPSYREGFRELLIDATI